MERVRPNHDSEPLELENTTVSPGNVLTRLSDGKPFYEVVDTQQGGGDGWPDGVIIQSGTEPDGLSFMATSRLEELLRTGKYSV